MVISVFEFTNTSAAKGCAVTNPIVLRNLEEHIGIQMCSRREGMCKALSFQPVKHAVWMNVSVDLDPKAANKVSIHIYIGSG